jgi:hypothetical protein
MADGIEPEAIPDPDLLFCRVHRAQYNFKEKRIMRVVFQKVNQSVDWSKYSTPEETVKRHKEPQKIRAVACITAGACRNLGQEVVHVPLGATDPGGRNDAHSEIRGEKTGVIQSRLRDAVAEVWFNPGFRQSI